MNLDDIFSNCQNNGLEMANKMAEEFNSIESRAAKVEFLRREIKSIILVINSELEYVPKEIGSSLLGMIDLPPEKGRVIFQSLMLKYPKLMANFYVWTELMCLLNNGKYYDDMGSPSTIAAFTNLLQEALESEQ